ncbi:MAG: hypothetical protein HOP10_04940 [Chitinophagaceae bacterium]|nr:hypothetical protein [Chitinophagaceae bacterium]
MPEKNLKEKLITKINETDDPSILEEVSHLFELQEPDTIYQVNDKQKKAIEEAEEQVKNKETLTDDEADKDIDEWLNITHANRKSSS